MAEKRTKKIEKNHASLYALGDELGKQKTIIFLPHFQHNTFFIKKKCISLATKRILCLS